MNLQYAESLGLCLFCPNEGCLMVLSVWEPDEHTWIDEEGHQDFGPMVCRECGRHEPLPDKEAALAWIEAEKGESCTPR